MNKTIGLLSVIAAIVVILCIITWNNNRMMGLQNESGNMDGSTVDATDNEAVAEVENAPSPAPVEDAQSSTQSSVAENLKVFDLIAEETQSEIATGILIPTWTYGGTVPGTEIRVTEGDLVQVNVTNQLEVPITIHWHGYPVSSDMDGIPGLTQDAILPGQTFAYEFTADVIGTYWYHSHQESSKQVDMGLYGALIVEPKDRQAMDRDYTLILDEWMENGEQEMDMSADTSEMSGMEGMGDMDNTESSQSMDDMKEKDPELLEEEMMKVLYNIYTVNGKSGELIQPLEVKQGETVRLRFINAGYRTHGIHIPDEMIKVVSTDGQDIIGAEEFQNNIVEIAPGERYDIEFTVQSEDDFIIDFHDNNLYNDQLRIPVKVMDGSGAEMQEDQDIELSYFDLTNYGSVSKGEFSLEQRYEVEQYIELNTNSEDGTLKYTINGETYKELQPILVKTNDYIKITYENMSKVDHPMHLHGHFFEVLSKNNVPVSGSSIRKDTLLIKPGEKYVIAFKADNPGDWIYHCHELHHAAGGMMQKIIYSDYQSKYIPDPNNKMNKPE